MRRSHPLILAALLLAACATTPTGRSQLQLVPESTLSSQGSQAFAQMKSKTPTDPSPAMNAYIRCIVDPMLAVIEGPGREKDWEVVVFKDPTANAFALPGKKIGVHTGLLPVAKTDAQLAAVLGHEIGHVIARHGGARVSQAIGVQAGLMAANAMAKEESRGAIMAALGMGAQVGILLPFSRGDETEADELGLQYMSKAGFNPREAVDLWQNMKAASGGKAPPQFLSTHPSNDSRIQHLTELQPKVAPLYQAALAAGKKPACQRP